MSKTMARICKCVERDCGHYPPGVEPDPRYPPIEYPGYHLRSIVKGVPGLLSKVREELEELEDAEEQGNRIMALIEASDLYRALELWALGQGFEMTDLKRMADTTARAFNNGART